MRFRSIQMQLMLGMGGALLLGVIIVAGIYAVLVDRLAERALVEDALPASVAAAGNDLERMLVAPLTAADGIAGNVLVQDWLASGEDAARQDDFLRYLQGVKAQQNALTTFIVSAGSGHYFTDKGLDRTLSRSASSDAWFYGMLDAGTPRTVQIDVDKSTGVPTLFINGRIEKDGKVLGIGGLGFSLASMSALIRDFRIGEAGRVFLVDAQGRVKVHPQAEFSDTRQLADLVGTEQARALLAGHSEAVRFERDGQGYLALARPLKNLDWLLVGEVPEAQVYGPARQALLWASLAGVVVALLGLLLVLLLARGLVRPIRQVTAALVEIGAGGGDLTRRLDDSRSDELGELARGFNAFIGGQRHLIGEVLNSAGRLRGAVGQMAQLVENTAERTGSQRQMTDMVATAVHEMGLTVQEIAGNASQAADVSHAASEEAGRARGQVVEALQHIERMNGEIEQAAGAVEQLAQQVGSIDQVLSVIHSISEQTNLLALNAAIEAARAGEMGRGFSVVADEVRTLASRTQSSTAEIQQMIEGLKRGADAAVQSMRAGQAATDTGVAASQRIGQSLEAISGQVERISDMNHQVATATEEQSTVTEDINRNVQGIADLAQATSGEVDTCRDDCRTLRQLADDLAAQVGRFRL